MTHIHQREQTPSACRQSAAFVCFLVLATVTRCLSRFLHPRPAKIKQSNHIVNIHPKELGTNRHRVWGQTSTCRLLLLLARLLPLPLLEAAVPAPLACRLCPLSIATIACPCEGPCCHHTTIKTKNLSACENLVPKLETSRSGGNHPYVSGTLSVHG